MDLFGIFKKKKKPEVKATPVPKKYTGSNAAVGKFLEPRLQKLWDQAPGDTNVSVTKKPNSRYLPNTHYSPNEDFKRKLKKMAERAV